MYEVEDTDWLASDEDNPSEEEVLEMLRSADQASGGSSASGSSGSPRASAGARAATRRSTRPAARTSPDADRATRREQNQRHAMELRNRLRRYRSHIEQYSALLAPTEAGAGAVGGADNPGTSGQRNDQQGTSSQAVPPAEGQLVPRINEAAAEEIVTVEDSDDERIPEPEGEQQREPEQRRPSTRRRSRSEGPRPRSTRARARALTDELSYSASESENDPERAVDRNLLHRVVSEMEAIFSEATISEDEEEMELTDPDEDDEDFLPAINVPGLQRLRVIVEELSNHDMARRSGSSWLVDVSSDEDTEEQRREWRRRAMQTVAERRRNMAAATQSGRSEQASAENPEAAASVAGAAASAQVASIETAQPTAGAASGSAHEPTLSTGSSSGTQSSQDSAQRQNDVSREFTQGPTKRARMEVDPEDVNESASSTKQNGAIAVVEDDDAKQIATCSICLDEMDEGGDHRLVVLKCGHCFGEACVKRWLMSGKRCCPMCNRQASLKDMRVVFLDCHRLGVSYELAEARKELLDLREREQRSIGQVRELNFKLKALTGQNSILIERVRLLEKGIQRNQPLLEQNLCGVGSFPKTQSFTKFSGLCKYMAYSDRLGLIAVSAKPTSSFFEGFSVELCSLYDLKSRRSKLLHHQEIKDLDFHETKPWLLSVSLDNTARLNGVDNLSLTSLHTVQLPCKVWSCSWSQANDTNFFLGLSDGNILEYDVRAPRDPIGTLKGPSANALPIVSLRSINICSGRSNVYGLACSQLRNMVRIYTSIGENCYESQDIMAAGNCFSLSYYAPKDALLVTSRTQHGQGVKSVTNELVSLSVREGETEVSVRSRFQSGGSSSIITKPTLCASPTNELWACCLDDHDKTIQVFSCDDASLRLTLKTQDPQLKQFTQVERILLPGRWDYALAGLSEGGLSVFA